MTLVLGLLASLAVLAPEPRWATLPKPQRMMPATTRGSVDVSGARIAFASYGSGDPVVFLHGGLGNAEQWSNQATVLAKRFLVITVDTRGHGRSTRGDAPATYDMMAADVVAVLDHLQLRRAAFVGFSDGGETALRLAMRFAQRVSRIFIVGVGYDPTNGSAPGEGRPTIRAYQALCRTDYARLSSTPTDFDGLLRWLVPLWRGPSDLREDTLHAISVPTLIAAGDHDEFVRLEHVRDLARAIPSAKLEVFSDASHFVMWQDPSAFNAALLRFLTGDAPASTPASTSAARP